MRNRFSTTLATLLPLILILSAGVANAQGDKDKFKARYESNSVNKEFDSHDFTGVWEMTRLDHSLGASARGGRLAHGASPTGANEPSRSR